MSQLKDYFEKIFVINLPYKEDRRERLVSHLESVGIASAGDLTWVRAISGDWCVPPDYFQAGGGAWGCLQSHLRIVQDAIMDGLENYLVLEDDVIFHERSPEMLTRFMDEVPENWDQLYLGGQHLHDPEPVANRPFVHSCRNVNRTHAFALKKQAFVPFQKHIAYAPDYIARGAWHVDHQLGLAHERGDWGTYAPAWWIAGQDEGPSNISGRQNPRLWWHPSMYGKELPFIYMPVEADPETKDGAKRNVHFGNNLKDGTFEDVGLDACVGSPGKLKDWLHTIAREAVDMALLPGIQHASISAEDVSRAWGKDAMLAQNADLDGMVGYPFNGLFPHPLNGQEPVEAKAFSSSSAA